MQEYVGFWFGEGGDGGRQEDQDGSIILMLTKQTPEEKNMETIRKNYRKVEDITEELKAVNLENFVDFNIYRDYTFLKCWS